MPDVCAKSQVYTVKEVKTGSGCSFAGYPTSDPNQVRSSVPDPVRHYERGGCGSYAMKSKKYLSKQKGVR